MHQSSVFRHVSLAVSLGIFGAAGLVIADATVAAGKEILVPYALLVIGATWLTRAERVPSFLARFSIVLGAFTLATVALYVAVAMKPATLSLSPLGHAWRIAAVVGVGALFSLAAARISGVSESTAA